MELIKKSVERTLSNLNGAELKGKVIHSDFFDESFLKNYSSYFNILFDYGFSEHFKNFDNVIENYSKLLKSGGYLVIIIPNLEGIYKKFMSKNLLEKHNLKIMNLSVFERTINQKFKKLFCDYVGGIYSDSSEESNIALLVQNESTRKFLLKLFKMLNKVMIYCEPFESKTFSPYLVYIGRKR